MTSHSNGQEPRIILAKGNDERGQGKAKKLANIAICGLFDRMSASVNRFDILCP